MSGLKTLAEQRESWERFGQVQLNHSQALGSHNLSGVLAFELSDAETEFTGIQSVPPSHYSHLISFVEQNDLSNTWGTSARASYIGRLNYDFRQKYLAEVLGRYDGSYLYAPGKRWGFFPGVSLGWRISEEPFMENAPYALSDLRLRAGWGLQGNPAVPPYASLILLEAQGLARTFRVGGREIVAADVLLLNTCSIREKAELTIRNRLTHFTSLKKKKPELLIGVLGHVALHPAVPPDSVVPMRELLTLGRVRESDGVALERRVGERLRAHDPPATALRPRGVAVAATVSSRSV